MATLSAAKSGYQFPIVSPGLLPGVIVAIQDLRDVVWKSRPTDRSRDVLRFIFGVWDQGGPKLIPGDWRTQSLSQNAALVKDLTSLLGQPPADGFNTDILIGKAVSLHIIHSQKPGMNGAPRLVCKVASIMPANGPTPPAHLFTQLWQQVQPMLGMGQWISSAEALNLCNAANMQGGARMQAPPSFQQGQPGWWPGQFQPQGQPGFAPPAAPPAYPAPQPGQWAPPPTAPQGQPGWPAQAPQQPPPPAPAQYPAQAQPQGQPWANAPAAPAPQAPQPPQQPWQAAPQGPPQGMQAPPAPSPQAPPPGYPPAGPGLQNWPGAPAAGAPQPQQAPPSMPANAPQWPQGVAPALPPAATGGFQAVTDAQGGSDDDIPM